MVQLILTNPQDSIMLIITWDVINNYEYSHIQVKYHASEEQKDPSVRIVRGLSEKFNYFCAYKYFYDLQYYFPLKFLTAHERDSVPPTDTKNYNQKNIS